MFRILLVDDDLGRSNKLRSEIAARLAISEQTIAQSYCITEAVAAMQACKYDAVVVDIVLPNRPGEELLQDGGLRLLSSIDAGRKIKTPSKIIGLTAFSENKDTYQLYFESRCLFVVYAEFNNNDWMKSIVSTISQSHKSHLVNKEDVNTTIVALHGIRTYGEWQLSFENIVTSELQDCAVLPYRYGVFSLLSFLIPFLRKIEVDRFHDNIKANYRFLEGRDVCFFAHSFGTYILMQTLEKYPNTFSNLNIRRVVLAGSVLPSSYNWPPLLETYEFDVVNDCGTRDLILCLSQCFVIGMGMAGRNGFKTLNGGRVTNRYFKGGHSLYFRDKRSHSDKFMRTYWLDLLIPSVKASIIDPRKSGLLLTRRSKVSDIMREWTKKLMQENYP